MPFADTPRIAYVVKRFPRYSETFILNEVLGHEAAGWEVEIFSLRPPSDTHFQDTLARLRAPVRYLPSEGLRAADLWSAVEQAARGVRNIWTRLGAAAGEDARDVHQALLLAAELQARRIDHLHAHFASTPTTVARLAARFADLPYTFTAHAKDIFHEAVQRDDLHRKLADAAATVTVSDFNLAFLRETFGSAAARVRRIYNGLDVAQFPFASPANRAPTLVAVGRLVEKKGFADLVEACTILSRRAVSFTCDIIGTGELEADLRARIEARAVGDHVRLLGPRPQTEVAEAVRQAAVFAAPCVIGTDGDRDGLPTTILEAMASGTPCVSTTVTGIPEVVRHEETGLTVAPHDPPALADALERLLTDFTLRAKLARDARALVEREFDVQRNSAELRALFSSVGRIPLGAASTVG